MTVVRFCESLVTCGWAHGKRWIFWPHEIHTPKIVRVMENVEYLE